MGHPCLCSCPKFSRPQADFSNRKLKNRAKIERCSQFLSFALPGHITTSLSLLTSALDHLPDEPGGRQPSRSWPILGSLQLHGYIRPGTVCPEHARVWG